MVVEEAGEGVAHLRDYVSGGQQGQADGASSAAGRFGRRRRQSGVGVFGHPTMEIEEGGGRVEVERLRRFRGGGPSSSRPSHSSVAEVTMLLHSERISLAS